ncbi:MAG: hypothetical protein WD885_02300 [Candidatus Saccharimonadales bacterium]
MTNGPEQSGEKIRLNINANVSFTPTDQGREILEEHYKDGIEAVPEGLLADAGVTDSVEEGLRKIEKGEPEEEPDDTVTMPLWELAHVLGPHIQNGSPQIIVDNVVLIEPIELE